MEHTEEISGLRKEAFGSLLLNQTWTVSPEAHDVTLFVCFPLFTMQMSPEQSPRGAGCKSGPGRHITDPLCQEGFVDSLVKITDHLPLFQGCLSTPKSWHSCASADLWHSHLGHLPSMKTGSATLVENCSLQKINAATWLAEKWELDGRFPFQKRLSRDHSYGKKHLPFVCIKFLLFSSVRKGSCTR